MIRSMAARMTALITANCIAALGVGGLTWAGAWISAIVSPGDGGVSSAIGWGLIFGLIAALYGFAISFPVFLVGLIVVGIPTWWILHQKGLRRRNPFMVTAAIESVIAGVLVLPILSPELVVLAPLLAIPGGLAGWAIWKYGYRPIKLPPVPPS